MNFGIVKIYVPSLVEHEMFTPFGHAQDVLVLLGSRSECVRFGRSPHEGLNADTLLCLQHSQ